MKHAIVALTVLFSTTAFAAKTLSCSIAIMQNGEILENVTKTEKLSLMNNPPFEVTGSTGMYEASIEFKSKDGRFIFKANANDLHQDFKPNIYMSIYDATKDYTMRSRGEDSAMIESLAGNSEIQGHEVIDGVGAGCRVE